MATDGVAMRLCELLQAFTSSYQSAFTGDTVLLSFRSRSKIRYGRLRNAKIQSLKCLLANSVGGGTTCGSTNGTGSMKSSPRRSSAQAPFSINPFGVSGVF